MSTDHSTDRPAGQATGASLIEHGTWKVIGEGSRVGFRVKKMGLYNVKGRFEEVEGLVEFPSGSSSPSGEVAIQAASINTRMPPRDWHLRTADFLAAKRYPRIRVRIDRIDRVGPGAFTAPATMEIRGVAEPVALTLQAHGGQEDARPGRARIHVQGVVDRHAFNIKATPPAEWVVAADVHIDSELLLERVD
jgi:polyisoprenoid-binding protein YceI